MAKKRIDNLGQVGIDGKWKKGKSGNPNGRPLGQKNYATLYKEALLKIATLNGKEPDEIELEMISNAIVLARKGDYKFYKDVLDRVHGTPLQKTDITSNGEQIAFTNEQANLIARRHLADSTEGAATSD